MAVGGAVETLGAMELEQYARDYAEAKITLHEHVDGLTDDDFNWRPAPDSWSMAECYDHLCMLGTLIVPRLDDGIRAAAERGWRSDGPFKYGALTNYFVKLAGPNQKRKFKAPAAYTPTSNHSISRLTKSFTALQDEFIERTQRANGIDLARVKVANPVLPILRLSLGQWFALIAGHQQRHFQQAEHVKRMRFEGRDMTK
jgi:hypothetical protein